jgi:hypothetical protein
LKPSQRIELIGEKEMANEESEEQDEQPDVPIIEIDWEGDPKDLKVFHPLTAELLFCGAEEFGFEDFKKNDGVLFVYSADEGDLLFATEEIAEICYGFEEFSTASIARPLMPTAEVEIAIDAAIQTAKNPIFFHITTYYMAHVPEPDVVVIGVDLTANSGKG